jgi:hypothetical protein
MRPRRKAFLSALAIAAVAAILPAGPVSSAQPQPEILGGVELGGYCASIGYPDVVIVQHHAFGWRCQKGTTRIAIDMVSACRWQYGNPYAIAAHRRSSDPYSWYCFLKNQ